MKRILLIVALVSGIVGLSGCNRDNDEADASSEHTMHCTCRAPLIGRAECVPAPEPMVETNESILKEEVVVPKKSRVVEHVERSADVVYFRPTPPMRRERSGKMRTGEIESQ